MSAVNSSPSPAPIIHIPPPPPPSWEIPASQREPGAGDHLSDALGSVGRAFQSHDVWGFVENMGQAVGSAITALGAAALGDGVDEPESRPTVEGEGFEVGVSDY